jgi:hypothetical protein
MKPTKRRVSDTLPPVAAGPSKLRRLEDAMGGAASPTEGADAPMSPGCHGTAEGQDATATRAAMDASPHTITPHTSIHDFRRRVSYLADDVVPATTSLVKPGATEGTPFVSSEENGATLGLELCTESDLVESLVGEPVGMHRIRENSKQACFVTLPVRVSTIEESPTNNDWVLRLDTSQQACLVVESKLWKLQALLLGLAALLYVVLGASSAVQNIVIDKNSVYVPGGGFSGFWYTLGRLNSIDVPLRKNYYCYSAGCLGVVAMLSNTTMETAYDVAVDAQKQWQRGEVSRYDVTEMFIDGILYGLGAKERSEQALRPELRDPNALRTLNIITSVRDGWGGLKTSIRTPSNTMELKEMLLQTTWIPFAISRDLWHEEHMDGAFTLLDHPRCAHHLGYAAEIDMMLNALNVNLSREKVALYWKRGLAQGL